jgi:hypothetical protein
MEVISKLSGVCRRQAHGSNPSERGRQRLARHIAWSEIKRILHPLEPPKTAVLASIVSSMSKQFTNVVEASAG